MGKKKIKRRIKKRKLKKISKKKRGPAISGQRDQSKQESLFQPFINAYSNFRKKVSNN